MTKGFVYFFLSPRLCALRLIKVTSTLSDMISLTAQKPPDETSIYELAGGQEP
jgi:hypothetical protein